MLDTMTADEFFHWAAYFKTEPMPERQADIRTAQIIRAILAGAGARRIPSMRALLPDWWGDYMSARQSPEQIKAQFDWISAARARKKSGHAT